MAEFAYNNAKNFSISHMPFEFNCGYHLCVSYKKDFDFYLKLKSVEELFSKPQKLMTICQQNLHHA